MSPMNGRSVPPRSLTQGNVKIAYASGAVDELLLPAEAAKVAGTTENHLRDLRRRGVGPAFYRMGADVVLYPRARLTEWSAE